MKTGRETSRLSSMSAPDLSGSKASSNGLFIISRNRYSYKGIFFFFFLKKDERIDNEEMRDKEKVFFFFF